MKKMIVDGYEIRTSKRTDIGIGVWEAVIYCNGTKVAVYAGFTRDEVIAFAKEYIKEAGPCSSESPNIGDGDDDIGLTESETDIYNKYITECSYSRRSAVKDLSDLNPGASQETIDATIDNWQDIRDSLDCPSIEGIDFEELLKLGLFILVVCTIVKIVN